MINQSNIYNNTNNNSSSSTTTVINNNNDNNSAPSSPTTTNSNNNNNSSCTPSPITTNQEFSSSYSGTPVKQTPTRSAVQRSSAAASVSHQHHRPQHHPRQHSRTGSLTMVQIDVEYRNESFTVGGGAHLINYSGTTLVGSLVPHGTGKLCYSNGVIYEGEFHLGKRSGSGTLYYKVDNNGVTNSPPLYETTSQWLRSAFSSSSKAKTGEQQCNWSIMGLWEENHPRSDCKFKVKTDSYEYLGYLQMVDSGSSNTSTSSNSSSSSSLSNSSIHSNSSTINGSGSNSSNSSNTSSVSGNTSNIDHLFELVSLSDFKKSGEGEMHNVVNNERYIGDFKGDMRNGYGIQVYKNKDRYFGGWACDKLDGFGTFMYNDGTMFQGLFHLGSAKGNGTMYWPNGDTMAGDWRGSQVKNGIYTKGSCDSCQKVNLYKLSNAIKEGLQSIEDSYYYNAERKREDKMSNALKWRQYKVLNEDQFNREQDILSELFTRKLYNLEMFEECVSTLLRGYNYDERWFTNSAISFFVSFFDNTYTTTGSSTGRQNETLVINDAKSDIDSFIVFLQDEIWNYFIRLFNSSQASQKLRDICKQSCMSMIRDHVHEQLAITCFELYNKTYQDKDILANQKLDTLRNRLTLGMLEIPKKFRPSHTERSELESEPYSEAVSILSTLPRKETISSKLDVLDRAYRSLVDEMILNRCNQRKRRRLRKGEMCTEEEELQKEKEDQNWEPSADDYTGVALYVYMKANIRNHHAQYHYINHYSDSSTAAGVLQLYEGVLKYIDDLDPALHTKTGALISAYSLSVSLDDAFHYVRRSTKSDRQAFSWLPHLLAFLSLETGRRRSDEPLFLEVTDNAFVNLKERLIKHLPLVTSLLEYAEKLGFDVVYETDKNKLFVRLCDDMLPPHVYNELSIQSSTLVYAGPEKNSRMTRTDSTLKRIVS